MAVAHLAVQLGADFVRPRLFELNNNDDAAAGWLVRPKTGRTWFEKGQTKT